MTVNEKIIKTLKPFGLPVREKFSNDDKEEYFTFNITDDRASEFGDNRPTAVTVKMQIHYVAPISKNYLDLKKKVRKALFENGFDYPEVSDETETGDTVRHIVFETAILDEEELI